MSDHSDTVSRRERAKVWHLDILNGVTLMHVHYFHQRFRPHRHDEFTIGAILEGLFGIEVDGAYRQIPAGSFSFLPPGALHTGECLSAELQYRNIYVSQTALERLGGLPVGGACRLVFNSAAPHDQSLLAEFVAAHERLENEPRNFQHGTDLEDVLAEIIRRHGVVRAEVRGKQPPPIKHPAVQIACQTIKAEYRQRLNLEKIADRAGVSGFHLIRLFKKETGLTPHAYLIWHRVKMARDLLFSGLTPAEAAVAVGFYDQSHLGRYFRWMLGATPGEIGSSR